MSGPPAFNLSEYTKTPVGNLPDALKHFVNSKPASEASHQIGQSGISDSSESGFDMSKMGTSADLDNAIQFGLQICARNKELEELIANSKKAESCAQRENERLEQRLFDAEQQLKRTASAAAHMEELENTLGVLEADKQSLAAKLRECERKLDCSNNKVARIEFEHAGLLELRDNEIARLTEELATERSRIRTELQQASAGSDLSFDLHSQLDSLAAQREELSATVDSLRQNLHATSHRCNIAERNAEEYKSRFEDAEILFEKCNKALEEERERTLDLQVQLNKAQAPCDDDNVQKGNSVFAELDDQRRRAEQLVKKITRELDECVIEKQALQSEVNRLKTQICMLKAQLYESASAADGATSQASASQLRDAQREIDSLREKLRLAEKRAHDLAVSAAAHRASSIGVASFTPGGNGGNQRVTKDPVLRAELAQTKQENTSLHSDLSQLRTRIACNERQVAELRTQLVAQRTRADMADSRCRELGAQLTQREEGEKENARGVRRQRRMEQIVVVESDGAQRAATSDDMTSGVSHLMTSSRGDTLVGEDSTITDTTETGGASQGSPLKPVNRKTVGMCEQQSGSGERPKRRGVGKTVDVASVNAQLERPQECNQQ